MPGKIPVLRTAGQARARLAYERRESRAEDKRFYALARWRDLRRAKLRADPLCEPCKAGGVITPAEHVHHKRPRKTHHELAFEWENLESVCKPCHNAMGADGGDR